MEEIASHRQLTTGTVCGHLATAIEAGEALELTQLIAPSDQEVIRAAFAKCGFGNLTGVHQTLDGRFDFGVLRIFRTAEGRGGSQPPRL